jgi:hypothetical protein
VLLWNLKQESKYVFIKVNSVHRLLHHVVMGDVANVSEVQAASIFMVEVCRLVSFCACTVVYFGKEREISKYVFI